MEIARFGDLRRRARNESAAEFYEGIEGFQRISGVRSYESVDTDENWSDIRLPSELIRVRRCKKQLRPPSTTGSTASAFALPVARKCCFSCRAKSWPCSTTSRNATACGTAARRCCNL